MSAVVVVVVLVASWVASVADDDRKCVISGSRSVVRAVDKERTSLRKRSTS